MSDSTVSLYFTGIQGSRGPPGVPGLPGKKGPRVSLVQACFFSFPFYAAACMVIVTLQ